MEQTQDCGTDLKAVAGAYFDPCTASFEQLVAAAAQSGLNSGHVAAVEIYRQWIARHCSGHPHLYAAWFNLGVELSCHGDLRGAMIAYQTALTLRPDFTSAAVNLGLMFERQGDAATALLIWMKATQPDDSRVALLNHQARVLEKNGQLEQAERHLRTSLLTQPSQPDVIQHWIHIRQKMCSWPVLAGNEPGLTTEQLLENCGPLAALALFDDVALQTRLSAGWIARKTTPTGTCLSPSAGYRHDRIRIGYMSSDFCRHAMSFLIAELFEQHDRTRFEVYGYCSTLDDGSDIRARVMSAFDHCRLIREMSDEQAAHAIRHDEIDILIDLNGLTQGSRLQVLRWRPAPVQATYLGFIGPVPLPELDFLLCDDFVVPPEIAPAYQPTPLYIAPNYQANDRKRGLGLPITRRAAGVPETGFIFCCFSNHYKITVKVFACWMTILRHVDGSWLWLIADNQWSCRNLRRAAAEAGVDPDRLVFTQRVDPSAYMSCLAVADLFLDTFPYNAGTIASDALRMGLPLLTQRGESFASRMAARLLMAVGADAGIASDTESYVSKAIDLANNPHAYIAYKSCLTLDAWAGTIGDINQLVRALEGNLATIVRRP